MEQKKEDNKHRLKKIASAFGMNVNEFAECIGYSRQALYQGACGIHSFNKNRLAISKYKLKVINQKLYETEKATADEMFQYRSKMIDDLIDCLTSSEDD